MVKQKPEVKVLLTGVSYMDMTNGGFQEWQSSPPPPCKGEQTRAARAMLHHTLVPGTFPRKGGRADHSEWSQARSWDHKNLVFRPHHFKFLSRARLRARRGAVTGANVKLFSSTRRLGSLEGLSVQRSGVQRGGSGILPETFQSLPVGSRHFLSKSCVCVCVLTLTSLVPGSVSKSLYISSTDTIHTRHNGFHIYYNSSGQRKEPLQCPAKRMSLKVSTGMIQTRQAI